MTEHLYSHVLVPTDFRAECRAAYRVAFAAALGSGATVSLLHVLPAESEDEYQGLDAIRLLHRAAEHVSSGKPLPPANPAAARALQLERLRAEIHPEWIGPIELRLEVRTGDVVAEIARYADESAVDLIVMGGPRPGLFRGFGRSLADRLARATPVKVVRVTPPALV
ncbi:Universal stress protein family protein [Gemmata sp. SH-PL17]|uniref:universal stress protein n=1 Tax=Gemmata sp. SH-PL17 TaxID=1630693 RepID=UPI0004ACCE6A|nr:universal stress protein [Gemmata sp. SH-PL17]AMV28887.1 Universal stress protein family protein [Gemmata sp. SH-PL17]